MGCRGVHFALSDDDAARVLAAAGDDESLLYLIHEEIEEEWDKDWLAQSDKAWDAIHRCLTDGQLSFEPITSQHLCILGGRQLHEGVDYIVSFVAADQVPKVAEAIRKIDEAWMRERYFAIPEDDYGLELTEEDFRYTWDWFQSVRELYCKAAEAGRAVMFTVDQ